MTETLHFRGRPSEPVRLAMCEWLRRHGIDPGYVPDSRTYFRRHDGTDGPPGLSCEQYIPTPDGDIEWDREREQAVIRTVFVPLEGPPLPFPEITRERTPCEPGCVEHPDLCTGCPGAA